MCRSSCWPFQYLSSHPLYARARNLSVRIRTCCSEHGSDHLNHRETWGDSSWTLPLCRVCICKVSNAHTKIAQLPVDAYWAKQWPSMSAQQWQNASYGIRIIFRKTYNLYIHVRRHSKTDIHLLKEYAPRGRIPLPWCWHSLRSYSIDRRKSCTFRLPVPRRLDAFFRHVCHEGRHTSFATRIKV